MSCKPYSPILLALCVIFFSNCTKEKIINNKVPVAEAGESQTVQTNEGKASAVLTGTGVDADGKVVAYIWSQVSGPDASEIVNEGAASTPVTGLISGTYLFQLMVVDDGGATGVDTVSIIVKGPSILTKQPSDNPNEVHIYGNSTFNASGAAQPEIGAASWTDGGITIAIRGAFIFDLSSIPATATITNAKLSLYSNPTPINGHPSNEVRANYGSDNSMLIQRVTTSWTANTVTWNNQPSTTTDDQIAIAATNQPFLDLINVDVTTLVKKMTGSNTNNGFLIRLTNESIYNSRIFCSSFYQDDEKHPKLVVTYTN